MLKLPVGLTHINPSFLLQSTSIQRKLSDTFKATQSLESSEIPNNGDQLEKSPLISFKGSPPAHSKNPKKRIK